jgi:DNA-binding XRE family transcriptional regulator
MTFAQIGAELGVGKEQARGLVLKGIRLSKCGATDARSIYALTAKARYALWHQDCHTREDAERVFRDGVTVGSHPGLGIVTAREIARWLGVPVIDANVQSAPAHRPEGAFPTGAGARLREERERLGLSQSEVADACGLNFKTVHNYEQEVNSTTLAFLEEFARLGGNVEYVIFGRRSA